VLPPHNIAQFRVVAEAESRFVLQEIPMKKPKTLRAAIYARYSTKHQNESSIEDQVRAARKICEREGFPSR
jgi:hypothetical protein